MVSHSRANPSKATRTCSSGERGAGLTPGRLLYLGVAGGEDSALAASAGTLAVDAAGRRPAWVRPPAGVGIGAPPRTRMWLSVDSRRMKKRSRAIDPSRK